MIESKFNYKPYLFLPLIVAVTIVAIYILLTFGEGFNGLGAWIFVISLLSFMNFVLIYFTVKTQRLSVADNQLIVTWVLGWGPKKAYDLKDISGYYTGSYTAKGNTEYITYITIQDKKIGRLSSGYHKNFEELMIFVEKRFTNLGPLKITILSEYKSLINTKNKLKT